MKDSCRIHGFACVGGPEGAALQADVGRLPVMLLLLLRPCEACRNRVDQLQHSYNRSLVNGLSAKAMHRHSVPCLLTARC
jgi:hypothetical protein